MDHPDNVIRTQEILGVKVINRARDSLGEIEEIMIDKFTGQVAYVVLATDGFLGMGGKFFAIPWDAIQFDVLNDCFVFDITKEMLNNSSGFDKNHWPAAADLKWGGKVMNNYYSTHSYWE